MGIRAATPPGRSTNVTAFGRAARGLPVASVALLAATAVAACGSTPPASVTGSRATRSPATGSPGSPPARSACHTTVVMPDSPPGAGPGRACVRLGSILTIRNGPGQSSGLEVWQLEENSAPAVLRCTSNPRKGNPVGAVCRAVKPGVAILGVSVDYVSGGVAQPKNPRVWHVTVTVAA